MGSCFWQAIRTTNIAPLAAKTVSDSAEVAKRYPGVLGAPIDFSALERRGPDSIIEIEAPDAGATYLYQSMQLPPYGWTIHRFTDLATVREDQRDGTIIGGAIIGADHFAAALRDLSGTGPTWSSEAAATQLKTRG